MTKWARMKRRKERKRAEALTTKTEEGEVKLTDPKNIPKNIQHSQEIERSKNIKTSKPNYRLVSKKMFYEHLSVIFIFSVLTIILTFPVILDFATEAAGLENCYDSCHMIWRFWWTDFSFQNNLDFQHPNYIFYPDGTDIGGNLAYFTTFIGFLLVQFSDYVVAWNIIWFLGLVFGGYGCYLLANNFNKNYLSSIIAGIIFTFTTYHMSHSMEHIGLSMIVWIPIFVLFLFKLLEKQSKYYAIVGGIIFFLVSLTHLYYSVFIAMFSIVFFTVYIFRQKKVSNKIFVTNFSMLLTIGLISTSILFLSNPTPNDESSDMPLELHIKFSTSLENLVIPTFYQTTQTLSDNGIITSFYSFFDKTATLDRHAEGDIFLGYSVIFLSALAVIRYRQNHAWFWLLICGIFVVMSFGPELKIFNQSTGIEMPNKVFYDAIPEWDEIRAPARFIVMANLALSILASYAVYGLIKNKFSSFKQQIMLASIIGFVILFEFSMIPYPSFAQPIPDIYEEIKNDESKFAILPIPIGGTGYGELMSLPTILYHQIHHEKPIYGGYESRPSLEAMESTQTYFLNMFQWNGSKDDVIKQDLTTHGLSLFDYFDIKYVTLHKELLIRDVTNLGKCMPEETLVTTANGNQCLPQFVPETRQLMSEILSGDNPFYEDDSVVVYKIPKSDSLEPFLLLGSGLYEFDSGYNGRLTMENFEILIVNPTNSEINTTLNVSLTSVENEKIVTALFNNKKLNEINIPTTLTTIQFEDLILKPGTNVVQLDADEFTLIGTIKVSLIVQSISITN